MTTSSDDRDPVEVLAEEFLDRQRRSLNIRVGSWFPGLGPCSTKGVGPALMGTEIARLGGVSVG
jgi:hypothetical protein